MRVSDSAKVVFVHVQKTGGSTINHIFNKRIPDARRVFRGDTRLERHSPYRRILSVEPGLADYWSFGFVRNPWSRMVSWYSMYDAMFTRFRAGDPEMIAKFDAYPHVWYPFEPFTHSFEDFVLGAPTIPKVGRTQVDMLSRPDGSLVDFVGRTESFAQDLLVVRERLGLKAPKRELRRNSSSHAHYSTYYTPELRDHVAEVYAADIETFGYTCEKG